MQRRSFEQADLEQLINEFLSHLHQAHLEMVDLMPRKIARSVLHLENELAAIKHEGRNYSPYQKAKMTQALKYLTKIRHLKCYGYNSSGFDIPVLFQGMSH